MYYSGYDPRSLKPVFVAKTSEEKKLQRALLQAHIPENRYAVIEALKKAGREDLIGSGPDCIITAKAGDKAWKGKKPETQRAEGRKNIDKKVAAKSADKKKGAEGVKGLKNGGKHGEKSSKPMGKPAKTGKNTPKKSGGKGKTR
jgi:hypothetical protein